MRLRVERFIQTRLRSMLLPATLGLGMALGGCTGDGLNADDGGEPIVNQDAAGSPDLGTAMKYIAQIPDAGPDLGGVVAVYSAPATKQDGGPAPRYMAQMADAGQDPGTVVAVYLAQMP
jgi:hypothetical protein